MRRRGAGLPSPRRAVILMVVLLLLTLMAVVGLSFVLYSDAAANSARIGREAESVRRPDVEPELLLGHFLGQLLYDAPDDDSGVYTALRGHSLARLMYGYQNGSFGAVPFNGTGRLHAPGPLPGSDDYYLINYTYFPADQFLRDPERLGWRGDLSPLRGPYTGGFNPPYTYPDLNNLFLAAMRADGTVLARSYHRDWLFNPGRALNDQSNPNWTNALGKYLTLRPRPVDMGPGFPYPDDATGDVKNLATAPGGNDSIWLDLDFPVMTAPDGHRYKPLFAPLIVDLDGRVNVNVHGNVRGRDALGRPVHVSNQGWGPWEVNLGYVLGWPDKNGQDEWPNLLLGTNPSRVPGRYGPDQAPGPAGSQALAGLMPHFYAQVDFDGCQTAGGQYVPGQQLVLPGAGAPPFQSFPLFQAGWDNLSGDAPLTERWQHPALANPLQPVGDDRVFAASNLEALLRHGDTGSAALTSELARLCPTNFADPRVRRLVTTHSFDLDQPGVSPWLYDPLAVPYAVPAGLPDQAPAGPPIPFPDLALRNTSVPLSSDFGAPGLAPDAPGVDWQAMSTALSRINLCRPLTPYPLPVPQTADSYSQRFDVPALAAQFQQAQQDRQHLAAEIYNRLLRVTGVPRSAAVPDSPTDQELQVRRWLAQLAVNIVDYIDEDDVSTPFNFYTAQDAGDFAFDIGATGQSGAPGGDPELPKYWVFGTELPHLVVNEVLVEYQDLPSPDPLKPAPTQVRVWVELHNPFQVPPAGQPLQPQDGFPVRLHVDAVPGKPGGYAPYRVVLATGLPARPFNDNVLGKPALVRASTTDADFAAPVPLMGGGTQPLPWPAVSAQAFFLAGPKGNDAHKTIAPPGGSVPAGTPWLQSDSFQYQYTPVPGQPDDRTAGVTVLLRRLANPHLPFDPNPRVAGPDGDFPANPWYNPYITVDYLERVPLHNVSGTASYASWGKRQPYAAHFSEGADQLGGLATKHTLGRMNSSLPASGHYDWLVHLDRQPVSPLELLHVSGYQPHQLTQRFLIRDGTGTDQKFQHYVPWFDQSRRLYRIFEFLEGRRLLAGGGDLSGSRSAGKINLNTIWDPETFLALCDPQPANGPNLTKDLAVAIYKQMMVSRTPNYLSGGGPGSDDRPFLGLATGYSLPDAQRPTRGAGINDTLLRAWDPNADSTGGGAGTRRLFGVPVEEHPYRQLELLTKIFNQVTTRSNVFAVWVTVGFFEVMDANARPVRLGAEVGRAEGRQVRHRLFAIVDRSGIPGNKKPVRRFDPRQDSAVLYFSIID